MIPVTRLNKEHVFINEDKIEFIEETPDTIISFETGKKLIVLERAEAVINLIREEKRRIYHGKFEGYTPHQHTNSDIET